MTEKKATKKSVQKKIEKKNDIKEKGEQKEEELFSEEQMKERMEKLQEKVHNFERVSESGKYMMTTKVRIPAKGDDTLIIIPEKRIGMFDKVTNARADRIETKHHIFPLRSVLTVEREKRFAPFSKKLKRTHVVIGNLEGFAITGAMKDMMGAEFVRTLLTYERPRDIKNSWILQMLVGGVILGIVLLIVLNTVLDGRIFQIIGELTLLPPSE